MQATMAFGRMEVIDPLILNTGSQLHAPSAVLPLEVRPRHSKQNLLELVKGRGVQ